MLVVNPKCNVEALFCQAIEEDPFLINTSENGESFLSYYDEANEYVRTYHFDDTVDSIANRILMDKEVEMFLPKKSFTQFLMKRLDPNVIMVMEKLVLLWDNEEGMSEVRNRLENEYGDEYAQYIAADDLLGQTWTDRQIPVINVSSIYRSAKEIHVKEVDSPFPKFFTEVLLQTIYHECRHLFYECNEIIPIGNGTPYPQDGGLEDEVENYGNGMAYINIEAFYEIVAKDKIKIIGEVSQE